jgi:TatD DNase family protein
MLIDSHVHLDMEQFAGDREEVVARAGAAGIGEMLNVGYDPASLGRTLALVERYPTVYGALGIHPHNAADWSDELEKKLREGLAGRKILAVGEIGLDYYRDLSPRDKQRDVFKRQIGIALSVKKPIVIHCREAFADVMRILREEGAARVGGVFHAFPGGAAEASEVLELGFLMGIGGPLTYKSSRLPEAATRIPSSAFILETDCPYLPPEPYRGKRNEPAYVALVRDELAALRGVDAADIERAAEASYRRLFHGARVAPAVAYTLKSNIYVNVTRACTNNCAFCLRHARDNFLYGRNLDLVKDPSAAEMVSAVEKLAAEGPCPGREIVFCGYGEPTCREADLLEASRSLRSLGFPLRLDTNGQGNMINRRDIVPELAEALDGVSVSLNAHDAASYVRLCRPDAGERAFAAVVDFIRRAAASRLECTVTVLDHPEVDVEACRRLVASIPKAKFRVRRYFLARHEG